VITHEDRDWWWAAAPTLSWTFAKTYAETAPHEYVILGRNGCPLNRDDFVRASKVIATFGEPAKFYSMTGIYLTSADGLTKWWTMDADLKATDLINQAGTDRVYGAQDAPVTRSGEWTAFDAIATDYDAQRSAEADDEVRRAIARHFGQRLPRTLDVGCGTGALLDLGVIPLEGYTGVDPSQGMLNMLVRKHPRVGRLVPARFEDAPVDGPYDLVVAMDVPDLDVDALRSLSSELVILTDGSSVEVLRGTGAQSA
jgi:SAM-dependent methyltransferase